MQNGNILFLILLAVALFVALASAVTASVRGDGRDASAESLAAQIALLENNAMGIRNALLRMTLTGGYEPWRIDYSKSGFSYSAPNATCATPACRLFDPDGGGQTGYVMPVKFRQSVSACPAIAGWAGKFWFRNISVKGIGMDNKRDLTLLYPGVSDALCVVVNDKHGVANSGAVPPFDTESNAGCSYKHYEGIMTEDVPIDSCVDLGDTLPSIEGKQMFCARHSNNCNYLWFVLIER